MIESSLATNDGVREEVREEPDLASLIFSLLLLAEMEAPVVLLLDRPLFQLKNQLNLY